MTVLDGASPGRVSHEPITLSVLARFHQEFFVPDMRRIVEEAVSASEARLRAEMHSFHDLMLKRMDALTGRTDQS